MVFSEIVFVKDVTMCSTYWIEIRTCEMCIMKLS